MILTGGRWWLCVVSAFIGASCSLLFEPLDSQPSLPGDAGGAANDASSDANSSGVGPAMLSDDFESGSLASEWSGLLLENGDSCTITTDQAAGGSDRSLRCTSNGASGTQAAIYFDFIPTNTLRVELDVRFDTLPDSFLTYLQTSIVSDSANTRLTSSDLYPNKMIDVWNFKDQSFEYVDLVIETETWYHIVFNVAIGGAGPEASVSANGIPSARLALDSTELPINRLLLGITLVKNAIEAHTMYMDNIVISEN